MSKETKHISNPSLIDSITIEKKDVNLLSYLVESNEEINLLISKLAEYGDESAINTLKEMEKDKSLNYDNKVYDFWVKYLVTSVEEL